MTDPHAQPIWKYRALVQLWFARLAGTAAAPLTMVAVAWQMYDLTGSVWDLGLLCLLRACG